MHLPFGGSFLLGQWKCVHVINQCCKSLCPEFVLVGSPRNDVPRAPVKSSATCSTTVTVRQNCYHGTTFCRPTNFTASPGRMISSSCTPLPLGNLKTAAEGWHPQATNVCSTQAPGHISRSFLFGDFRDRHG